MNKKKVIIITSSVLGALALGFIAYRLVSRYNKDVVMDGSTTILISKEEPTDVEVVEGVEQETGAEKIVTASIDADLMEYETQSGMGDY